MTHQATTQHHQRSHKVRGDSEIDRMSAREKLRMSSKAMDAARRPAAKRDTRSGGRRSVCLLLPIKGVSANRFCRNTSQAL